MNLDNLTFTKNEIDKVHAISEALFPMDLALVNIRKKPSEEELTNIYEHSIRMHTIVAILAEMQKRQVDSHQKGGGERPNPPNPSSPPITRG